MVEKFCCYDKKIMFFFKKKGREDEGKGRQENGQTWFFFQSKTKKTTFFGHIFQKKLAHSLFGVWSFIPLGPHSVHT